MTNKLFNINYID